MTGTPPRNSQHSTTSNRHNHADAAKSTRMTQNVTPRRRTSTTSFSFPIPTKTHAKALGSSLPNMNDEDLMKNLKKRQLTSPPPAIGRPRLTHHAELARLGMAASRLSIYLMRAMMAGQGAGGMGKARPRLRRSRQRWTHLTSLTPTTRRSGAQVGAERGVRGMTRTSEASMAMYGEPSSLAQVSRPHPLTRAQKSTQSSLSTPFLARISAVVLAFVRGYRERLGRGRLVLPACRGWYD